MLKQFKKFKVFIIMIVIFILCYLSVTSIHNISQMKYEKKINEIVLDLINDRIRNMKFNVKGEDGNYFLDFIYIELKSESKEIIKFNKGKAKVSYVFKHSQYGA